MDVDTIIGCIARHVLFLEVALLALALGWSRWWFVVGAPVAVTHLVHVAAARYNTASHWPGITADDVAVVTGGCNGLGAAIVLHLLARGLKKVVIIDVEKPLHVLDRCLYVECDLAKADQVKSTIDSVINDLARQNETVSILVSNAGIRVNGSVMEVSELEMHRSMQINFFSPVMLIKKVLENHFSMSTNGVNNSRLTLVCVSSVLGWISPARLSMYSASKAALTSVNESLMREMRLHPNVRVLYATPGQLDTRMFQDVEPSKQYLAPLVNAEELAAEIVLRIHRGEQGNLCQPIYANVVPAIASLPIALQDLARKLGNIDTSI